MASRRDFRAIRPGADEAQPGAMLMLEKGLFGVLGGLLLLSAP
jgi:hypothetical protein